MNTIFTFQITIGVFTIHLKRNRLNTSLIAFQNIGYFYFVIMIFAITHIHTHQHLSPILRFGTASSSHNFNNGAQFIFFTTEHITHFEVFYQLRTFFISRINFIFCHGFFFVKIECQLKLFHTRFYIVVARNPVFNAFDLFHLFFSTFLIEPKFRSLRF